MTVANCSVAPGSGIRKGELMEGERGGAPPRGHLPYPRIYIPSPTIPESAATEFTASSFVSFKNIGRNASSFLNEELSSSHTLQESSKVCC